MYPQRFDPVATQKSPVGFPAIKDEEPINGLLFEHLFERFKLEVRAAAVHVEVKRFGRLDDRTLEISAITIGFDCTTKDRKSMQWRALVVFEPGEDGGDGTLDIGFGLFALDVCTLTKLIFKLIGNIVDLLVRGDIDRDKFRPVSLL